MILKLARIPPHLVAPQLVLDHMDCHERVTGRVIECHHSCTTLLRVVVLGQVLPIAIITTLANLRQAGLNQTNKKSQNHKVRSKCMDAKVSTYILPHPRRQIVRVFLPFWIILCVSIFAGYNGML